MLPLVIPTYVGAFLFISALGPGGLLQQALDPLGIGRLPEVYGLGGATLTLALLSYPYLLLTLRGTWSSLDPAAEGLGAKPRTRAVECAAAGDPAAAPSGHCRGFASSGPCTR